MILHNSRIVECRNVAKSLSIGTTYQLYVTNIKNPGYNTVASSFKMEILTSDKSEVLNSADDNPAI